MGLNANDMRVPLKYVIEDVDRYGNVRCYVRAPGIRKVRLRSMPGTAEFLAEYHAAIGRDISADQRQADETKRGSFRHLCVRYFGGRHFTSLDISTQNWQRRALDAICTDHGSKPMARMSARHVRRMRDAIRNRDPERLTPAAANQLLKALRALFSWANEEEETSVNPTIGVKSIRYSSDGHHTWTVEEIHQYQQRHPIGTQARLALDILRFTTGRREDAARLGRQHIRDDRVRFRQAKNEHRHPIEIDIPLHPEFKASIEAAAIGNMTLLVTEFGKPFTANGFGGKFKDCCRQADLPHCSAHGVRKATATALAEANATPHQIMAITGHQSLKEVERYTRAAQRNKMADEGMAKLK